MTEAEHTDDFAGRVLLATLPHVPFEGWSEAALKAGARDAGFDESLVAAAFPGGVIEAVESFARLADLKLEEEAAATDLAGLRTGARVALLVRRRLEPWADQREAVRRAVSFLALPGRQLVAARCAWRTADSIWFCAGGDTTDITWYTRRAILASVYTATLLVWLDDRSEGSAETWEFLDRRLKDVGNLTKWRVAAQRRLETLPNLFKRNPFIRPRRSGMRM